MNADETVETRRARRTRGGGVASRVNPERFGPQKAQKAQKFFNTEDAEDTETDGFLCDLCVQFEVFCVFRVFCGLLSAGAAECRGVSSLFLR
jgi:hypothetical protein